MKLLKVTASETKNKRYSAHFKKDDGKIKVVSFGSPPITIILQFTKMKKESGLI